MRSDGRVRQIGIVALAFALALLACGPAAASDVERQIPAIRDSAGSGVTMEISREGTRQTATPFVTLNAPTVDRIEERIAKQSSRLAAKESLPGTGVAVSPSGNGTSLTVPGEPENGLSSLSPVPGEITARSVKAFLKGLRKSRKAAPAPAVVSAPAEKRLGMADTPRHGSD